MGLFLGGKPYEGAGLSGEVWKLPYLDGTLEDYVSTRAIKRNFQKQCGSLFEVKQIAEQAFNGNSAAIAAFNDFGLALGVFLSFCVAILDPDIIYIGGGISECNSLYNQQLHQSLEKYTLRTTTDIKYCHAIDETPLYGIYHLYISSKKELTTM